jgi:hypothetical protein
VLGTGPLPLYFAQSLRNRDFMLVPVVRAAIWPAQMGAVWGEVLSTFRSGSFDKDIGRALQQLFLALVFLTLWSMPLLLSDAQHKTKCFHLVLNSAIDLHADDAAIGIDIDRA